MLSSITLGISIVTAIVPSATVAAPSNDVRAAAPPAGTAVVTVSLELDGVHCATCLPAVQRAVRDLAGVVEVRGGTASNHLVVDYDDKRLTERQILDVIAKAGYTARVRR